MKKYLIVIEKDESGSFGAYSPDLPGCVVVGGSQEETEQLMYDAIAFHLAGLKEEGMPVPDNKSSAEYLLVPEAV
jgi:predicted RNase H-like HicB family nuclease